MGHTSPRTCRLELRCLGISPTQQRLYLPRPTRKRRRWLWRSQYKRRMPDSPARPDLVGRADSLDRSQRRRRSSTAAHGSGWDPSLSKNKTPTHLRRMRRDFPYWCSRVAPLEDATRAVHGRQIAVTRVLACTRACSGGGQGRRASASDERNAFREAAKEGTSHHAAASVRPRPCRRSRTRPCCFSFATGPSSRPSCCAMRCT
jgi:hypothetical protein